MKPMLADDAVIEKLNYPLVASPKLDGVRAIVYEGKLLARSMKLIPNLHVYNALSNSVYEGLDGELIFGPPNAPDVCRKTMSAVMGHGGQPHVSYYVFDLVNKLDASYKMRYEMLKARVEAIPQPNGVSIKFHRSRVVHDLGQLRKYEDEVLEEGYEGLIVRNPASFYKFGRSTAREGIMLKIKRFTDGEAEIIGFEEEMHNTNEATKNELGRTKRSSAKEGLVGKDTLGAFVCKDLKTGAVFNCGTGITQADRQKFWNTRASLEGGIVKYKSFKIGEKDAPRHPVFLGFRDKRDMS